MLHTSPVVLPLWPAPLRSISVCARSRSEGTLADVLCTSWTVRQRAGYMRGVDFRTFDPAVTGRRPPIWTSSSWRPGLPERLCLRSELADSEPLSVRSQKVVSWNKSERADLGLGRVHRDDKVRCVERQTCAEGGMSGTIWCSCSVSGGHHRCRPAVVKLLLSLSCQRGGLQGAFCGTLP